MINYKRLMHTATTTDNLEDINKAVRPTTTTVTGMPIPYWNDFSQKVEWAMVLGYPINDTLTQFDSCGIDPETIEPLALPVERDDYGGSRCPNCGYDVFTQFVGLICGSPCGVNYCPSCGQRLDWSVSK